MKGGKLPTPSGYCPVFHRNHLPIEMQVRLPSYGAQFPLVGIVQRCLCSSVAYGEIMCDPVKCTRELGKSLDWVETLDTKSTFPAFSGCCKRIYRDYAKADSQTRSQPSKEIMDLVWEAMYGDED